jgi:sugar/nucleoside kinase (ribokinase family)
MSEPTGDQRALLPVVCVGQLVADVVVRPVTRFPEAGRAEMVEDIQLLSGGCAANTAAVLAKLGVETRIVSVIGRDALGDAALADLAAAGVIVDDVRRDPEAQTSVAIVLVDGEGQRSFFYRGGGNERLTNANVHEDLLRAARIVHVGGAMKLLELDIAVLMKKAKSHGALTSLDTDWDTYGRWMKTLEGALPAIDFLMTNAEEAAILTGISNPLAAGRDLLARGPRVVLIKRGELGAILVTGTGAEDFPAYKVAVRDTTCAGDAFAAGFLRGVSAGLPLEESVRLGNAAGALCTTQISHRAITSFDDVTRLLERETL